ncbi:HD domain-containing phosphohydrolase [uncultured Desulfobacter sp.]|uniref:HD-GYP domain-containing protein n=1 Tax=uncultured Desulfobacter sp. TaxID=240139 RepID=UPI002AAC0767|nr:HD domain-containing phosphohydrolase [uncultured Desulfobacter sp.]
MISNRQTILVVDDLPENIDILVNILRSEYNVRIALTGQKAIRIVRDVDPPDLILLDVMMPDVSGYEVARILKEDVGTRSIPIIFITAMNSPEDEQKGLQYGAVDYIVKPVYPHIVKARVHNQLELKMHRDHLEELVHNRTKELELTRDVTILTLASLAETRDDDTGGHIRRTQEYVRILALELSAKPKWTDFLNSTTIDLIHKSAPLHDIGKVGIPDAILLKPDRLTDEEFNIMKRHTILGRDTILRAEESMLNRSASGFLRFARQIAYTHHEKWDGSGYPQGLKGLQIPLSGRIMALADVYDALISKRVYKPPFTHAKARNCLLEGSGSHFDPDVVAAFMACENNFRQAALEFADFDEEREALSQY